MDLSNNNTAKNLEAAFGGESMANRKYLFFAEVTKKLGMQELAKLFKETANQETEHAFAHFRLLHPELTVDDFASLTENWGYKPRPYRAAFYLINRPVILSNSCIMVLGGDAIV
ncbi:MAG: rubrerythrin family protein [Coleofasciculus sp. G3-WIS-01]